MWRKDEEKRRKKSINRDVEKYMNGKKRIEWERKEKVMKCYRRREGKETEGETDRQKERQQRVWSCNKQRLWLNKQDNSVMLHVRCLLSHCSICMWKRRQRWLRLDLFPAIWLADRASAQNCSKAPLLGVHEPSHGYSHWAQYVKRLLLAVLAKKTNRGREAHNERE